MIFLNVGYNKIFFQENLDNIDDARSDLLEGFCRGLAVRTWQPSYPPGLPSHKHPEELENIIYDNRKEEKCNIKNNSHCPSILEDSF